MTTKPKYIIPAEKISTQRKRAKRQQRRPTRSRRNAAAGDRSDPDEPAPKKPKPRRVPPPSLLIDRAGAAAMLGGISIPTIIRVEKRGLLRAIRLSPGTAAPVFYEIAEVQKLAAQGAEGVR